MKEISIAVKRRSESGKGSARQTRREGYIPGIVYGPETEPIGVAVEERAFRSSMRGAEGTSIINLDVEGKKSKVVIREIQRDPVTSRIIHLDFHAIPMNKPIHVSVPIHFTGTPVGVKTDGGIMQVTLRELSVSCLPVDIPGTLDIDVSGLHIGDSVHVKDISIANAKVLTEERRTIVVIAAPTVVKEVEPAVAEGEEAEVEGVEAEEAAAAETAEGAETVEGTSDSSKKKE